MLDITKDFMIKWREQIIKNKTMLNEERIIHIKNEIGKLENQYGGTFKELYGQLTDLEIDGLDEAGDVFDWKELELIKEFLIKKR